MTPHKRWDELEELFNAARDLPTAERESFLDERSLDADVRREVNELLSAYDALATKGDNPFLEELDTSRASSLLEMQVDDSEPALLSPGDRVGRYRIERLIGRGGMGVLYLAVDPRLNRSVALKLLPSHSSLDSSASRRFEEEARAASLLDHPNIATVYEVDETSDGRIFIAMAYYEGETLREKLKRGPLEIADAANVATQVAQGLKAAHATGLVHRDIKPANIIVTQRGVAKIVDFGIARIAADELTNNADTAGTVAYMSPEQTRGAPPHPAMDVWSFGVMLYEMLTGVRPFRGVSDVAVIRAICNDEPEPLEKVRGENLPARLVQIVERCLHKNASDRYADAGAIEADLQTLPDAGANSIASGSSAEKIPAAKSGRWKWQTRGVAAVAGLAILGAGALGLGRGRVPFTRSAATVPQSIAVLPFQNQLNAADTGHFAEGLADELITALGAIPDLKVAASTSTFALYDAGLDARTIGDSLGVVTLLEGSLRRDRARLTISARLVQARDHAVLWSKMYDVPVSDVFIVEEEIARSVANALEVHLSPSSRDSLLVGRPTTDLAAWDLYLRGRHVRTRPTRERLEQALADFRDATERDPRFANAYSGLAETYVNLANFGYVSPAEGFTNANIAAEQALKLNPRLAEAYASQAYVLASRRAFDQAEAAFHRAIYLSPNFALGRHYYSLLLAMLDRTDEALDQNGRARDLDPLLVPAATDYGIILCQRGELARADTALTKALALEPKFALSLYWLGAVRAAERRYSEALQLLEQAARASPDYPGVLGALAYVNAHAGRTDAADSIVASLRARATNDRGRANLAFAYAALGKRDPAFALLKPDEWDVPVTIGLRADPLLASLRSDARYPALVSAIVRPTSSTASAQ
jgi:serine/threonine-protein kinase